MKKKILIVDDEQQLAETVKEFLEGTGEYDVHIETDGIKAMSDIQEFKPDLVLLDVMLPGMNGFEICKSLQENKKFSSIPVIILSARGDEPDKVAGLDIGADDYMVKPFSMSELRSRVRAILRRKETEDKPEKIKAGDIIIDTEKHEVIAAGKTIKLTMAEFGILELLTSRKNYVFTRPMILEHLWGEEKCVVERTVDVHIRHLRSKLGKSASTIKNIRGLGYKIEA